MGKRIYIKSDSDIIYRGEGSLDDWREHLPNGEIQGKNYEVTEIHLHDSETPFVTITRESFSLNFLTGSNSSAFKKTNVLGPVELGELEQLLASTKRG